jgi:hypothetical protein
VPTCRQMVQMRRWCAETTCASSSLLDGNGRPSDRWQTLQLLLVICGAPQPRQHQQRLCKTNEAASAKQHSQGSISSTHKATVEQAYHAGHHGTCMCKQVRIARGLDGWGPNHVLQLGVQWSPVMGRGAVHQHATRPGRPLPQL